MRVYIPIKVFCDNWIFSDLLQTICYLLPLAWNFQLEWQVEPICQVKSWDFPLQRCKVGNKWWKTENEKPFSGSIPFSFHGFCYKSANNRRWSFQWKWKWRESTKRCGGTTPEKVLRFLFFGFLRDWASVNMFGM